MVRKLIQALLWPINTTAIILLAIYTVVWGFWLANPWWHAFNRAALYSEMADFAPEWAWGFFAVFCGLVTAYGAIHPSYRALVIGAGAAFIHWLLIAIFYFWGDWQNTGGITSLTFAIYAAYTYLNVRVNYRDGNRELAEILH
jgi:hypothetical protein